MNEALIPSNVIFNITVCIIGIAILLIHTANLLFKKNKRKDENHLLLFLAFTVIHFATYLTFSLIKINYTSDAFIKGFYTVFYIFNNIEALLLFLYMLSYVEMASNEKKFLYIVSFSLLILFVILDIVNIFTGIFFSAKNGEYVRSDLLFLAQGYQVVMLLLVFVVTVLNGKLLIKEKVAFATYCLLPVIAIVLQIVFKGYAIAYLSIILSIEILFFFLNVQKNIALAKEEEKNKEAQVKIMMSQIQPHFIYNSLSSISTLISIDPKKAQKVLDDFTEYLRHNLSSLTETHLISFEEELRHIEAYLSLERLRFNDRLKVVFDINTYDFEVPPLSIQPIVENAVKHGILKKLEGGTITIKVSETDEAHIVEVKDDGIGFNMNNVNFTQNDHIGINNIRTRLKAMCKADISIDSEVNKGTSVVVTFYK